jgi:hypothetical protein
MARTKWDELLPNNSSPSPSRSEMAQQLVRVSAGGSSDTNPSGGSSPSSVTEAVSSLIQGPIQDFTSQVSSLATQMTTLTSIQQTQFGATQDNTQALLQNTIAQSSSGASVGSTVSNIASTVLGGGSILSPILSGLMSLFSGGDSSQTSTATLPFMLPAPVQYQTSLGTNSPGQTSPASQGVSGQSPAQAAAAAAPQVNIQVNAMDSQSFLDHRDEIARAVREVLLTSNSLNDVISGM